MGLINPGYWEARFGKVSPCWSGDKYLDWEHGIISRHAFRRVFPSDAKNVLDVGCGDGAWTLWLAKEFGVDVYGVDALEWPHARERIPFELVNAEELEKWYARSEQAVRFFGGPGKYPDLLVFMNALTCTTDWRAAVSAATKVCSRIICFDNFQSPTPAHWASLPHRKPIQVNELVTAFEAEGFHVAKATCADWFHRKWLLHTPEWTHAAVAAVTCLFDLAAAHLLRPRHARHSAWLFERGEHLPSKGALFSGGTA